MRRLTALLAIFALVAVAAPATAQTADENLVQASNPSFSWTGKEDQQASFEWSSTITNPSRRTAMVQVSMQLLDANGAVVASDTQVVTLESETDMTVGGGSSIAYSEARSATQYRIVLAEAPKS